MAQKRKPAFQISYVTITYRSVFLAIVCVLALIAIGFYFAFPERSSKIIDAGQASLQKLLVKVGLASASAAAGPGEPGPQQAHFTNIDGTVRVKKANTNTWVTADYNVALERGDVVQTTEGIAKVVFTDGTNYTVKPDSLIVVQENSLNSDQQTSVAVQVTTGTVDLTTGAMGRGSKSQVLVAGAVASIGAETSAQVVNDPRKDDYKVLVKHGTGEVQRDNQVVKLGEYEQASFTAETKGVVKTKEIGPPTLIEPPNMGTATVGANAPPVTFSWTPMDNVKGYHIKISRNSFFTSLLFDKNVTDTSLQLQDLPVGSYYWEVVSIGPDGKESIESEKNRFTAIPKGEDKVAIALELDPFVQHGHVIEVRGRTEPGARVMVNGQGVALVGSDGSFSHFTMPLPTGENTITVTAQNSKGGVNTKQQAVVIQ